MNLGDEYIDSRDVIERIAALASDEAALDDNEKEELEQLLNLQAQVTQYCTDWQYGVGLIREDCFIEYCQEEVEDCGYIPRDLPWWIAVDWKKTAHNMRADYTPVDVAGHTYLFR